MDPHPTKKEEVTVHSGWGIIMIIWLESPLINLLYCSLRRRWIT